MQKRKRFWREAGEVSEDIIVNLVMFTGALAGLIFLIRPSVRKHKKLDLKIFDLIEKHRSENNTKIMQAITFFGTHTFFIPANLTLISYFLFVKKRSWFSIRIASIALSSLGMMFLLKALFKRKRPVNPLEEAKGLSFPSGHAIMSATFYGLLIYIISQTVKEKELKLSLIISLLIFIQLIGFSRVYLRVHYASDVAIGYVAGSLWLLLSLDVLKKIEEYNKALNEDPDFGKQLNLETINT